MSESQAHRIQLVGLINKGSHFSLIRLGLIIIQDRDHVTFNPSIRGFNNLRWTWHKDGVLTVKQDEKILHQTKKQRLDKFKEMGQLLEDAYPIRGSNLQIDYNHIDQSQIYTVDLRNYRGTHFNISISLTSYHSLLKCCKIFSDRPNHQVFIYMKSKPYLVITCYDPTKN